MVILSMLSGVTFQSDKIKNFISLTLFGINVYAYGLSCKYPGLNTRAWGLRRPAECQVSEMKFYWNVTPVALR